MENCKIYNEDCLIGLDKLEDNSLDLIVTSPPYYNVKDYSHWNSYDEYLNWLKSVFTLIFNKLKSGRMCCVNISTFIIPRKSRNSESQRIALPFHFVNLMENIGYKFLEDIIWEKPDGAVKNRNGKFSQHRQPVAYKPNVVNEYIFVFQKPADFLIDKIVRNYKDKTDSLIKDGYERTNIWKINPETKSKHPAPFPYKLAENLILYYSYIDDLICDPFLGSGTTARAAIYNKRNFIGYEINEEFYKLSTKFLNRRELKL